MKPSSKPQTLDDQDWFELLAGRQPPAADVAVRAGTRAEATLLRQALRAWPAAVADDIAPHAVDALLAQAGRAGVLAPRGPAWCGGCAARWARWRAAWQRRPLWNTGLGLGAACALVALMVGVLPPRAPDAEAPAEAPAEVLRGADGVLLLTDAQPEQRRDRIASVLGAAGIAVTRYQRLGRYGLDATVPADAPAELRAGLARQGLTPAADGSLRVEVQAAPP